MAADPDRVLAALTDEAPTELHILADDLSEDRDDVASTLDELKQQRKVRRVPGGWVRLDPEPPSAPPPVDPATAAQPPLLPEPETTMPKVTKPRGRPRKTTSPVAEKPKRKYTRRAPAGATAVPATPAAPGGGERECEFAVAESGAILFRVVAGPRRGEIGSINHVDAMALYRLMQNVDFIRENA